VVWLVVRCARLPFAFAAFALMRRLIAVALVLGIVLLSLLFYASSDSSAFSDTLPILFIGGGLLGVALLVLLGWRLWWLQRRIRRGVFGAKLTLKLLLMFGAVALLPGLVVYGAFGVFSQSFDRDLVRCTRGQRADCRRQSQPGGPR